MIRFSIILLILIICSSGTCDPCMPDDCGAPCGNCYLYSYGYSFGPGWCPDGNGGHYCDCDGNYSDCAGVCGGPAFFDECGICDGPGAIYECGCNDIIPPACDCDNNLMGCDGVCGSGIFLDCEEECGGDDLSCADCSGVLNGDSFIDNCGECVLPQDQCVQDCNGDWGGIAVLDDCGICDGINACVGCTDVDGCNYEEDNTTDDGSCTYPEENFDCDGNCTEEYDECGICNGPGAIYECGCNDIIPPACDCDNNLTGCDVMVIIESIILTENGLDIQLNYTSTSSIAGFQFDFLSDDALTVTTVGGGASSELDGLTSGNNVILGFSFTGNTLPPASKFSHLLTLSTTVNNGFNGLEVFLNAVEDCDDSLIPYCNSRMVFSSEGGAEVLSSNFTGLFWVVGTEY